jgi:hypothetical protein
MISDPTLKLSTLGIEVDQLRTLSRSIHVRLPDRVIGAQESDQSAVSQPPCSRNIRK